MTRHVFLDETKRHGYVVAAVAVPPGDLAPLRSVVRGLVLPGQRRVHMKDEREFRRREIAAALVDAGVEVVIYDAGRRHPTQRQVREECLRAVVTDAAAEAGEIRLVLEQDDSLVQWDAQRFIELARAAGCRDWLRYDHLRAVGGAAVGGAGCGGVVLGMRRGVAPSCGPRRTSDPPGVNPHGPGNARSPSAASVRTGLGLTSRSSMQRAPPIIRAEGGHGAGPVWTAVRRAVSSQPGRPKRILWIFT